MSGTTKIAHLIWGLQSCGKTTLGRARADDEGGVCLSFDDYFYTVINPKQPNKFNFRPNRMASANRWFWMQLKKLCDADTSPIYIDQINVLSPHTINTAGFLAYRYGYKIELVEPTHPLWLAMKPELAKSPRNYDNLLELAQQAVATSEHPVQLKSVVLYMEHWENYTVEDLLDQY